MVDNKEPLVTIATDMAEKMWGSCIETLERHGEPDNALEIIALALVSTANLLGAADPHWKSVVTHSLALADADTAPVEMLEEAARLLTAKASQRRKGTMIAQGHEE